MRAGIYLRKTLGRDPTRQEVEDALGPFKDVSQDDVRDALDSGDEVSTWYA